jgi:hypothetical protein
MTPLCKVKGTEQILRGSLTRYGIGVRQGQISCSTSADPEKTGRTEACKEGGEKDIDRRPQSIK